MLRYQLMIICYVLIYIVITAKISRRSQQTLINYNWASLHFTSMRRVFEVSPQRYFLTHERFVRACALTLFYVLLHL